MSTKEAGGDDDIVASGEALSMVGAACLCHGAACAAAWRVGIPVYFYLNILLWVVV
jgi:hypothetical protein